MKVTTLPSETSNALGFTHKFTITHADLTGAGTTCTLRLLPEDSGNLAIGKVITAAGYRLVTPFDASGDAAINSLLLDAGISSDTDCLIDQLSTQLAADGTYKTHMIERDETAGVTLPYVLVVGDYVVAVFTVAGGATPTIDELDAGEIEIYLGLKDMNELAND